MGCRHNYVFTQGYFYCTKCHKRSNDSSSKRRRPGKKVIAVIIVLVLGIFAYSNGIFEINTEKLNDTIQNIPLIIDDIPLIIDDIPLIIDDIPLIIDDIPSIPLKVSKSLQDVVDLSADEINQLEEKIYKATLPEESSEDYAIKSIEYINQKRFQNGKTPISHDSRVYELAMARAKDMHEYKYLDHTNPITGTCPYNIKSNFGLTFNENVAENAYLFGTETNPVFYNPSHTEIIDGWMDSTGHRINLLSYEHIAGSVACYGGFCVFLGLNHGNYGEGCSTASEGAEFASRFDNCTLSQMEQYEKLQQAYDKIPEVVNSETEYQNALNMYDQIENYRC